MSVLPSAISVSSCYLEAGHKDELYKTKKQNEINYGWVVLKLQQYCTKRSHSFWLCMIHVPWTSTNPKFEYSAIVFDDLELYFKVYNCPGKISQRTSCGNSWELMIKKVLKKGDGVQNRSENLWSTRNCRISTRDNKKEDSVIRSGAICSILFSITSPFDNSHALVLINWFCGLLKIFLFSSLSGWNVSLTHLLSLLRYLKVWKRLAYQ